MFKLAVLIGLFSYSVFVLGLLHLLNRPFLFVLCLIFAVIFLTLFSKKIRLKSEYYFKDRINILLAFLLSVQIVINFIGVLGPEISFDALWYHLTLPKLYFLMHS